MLLPWYGRLLLLSDQLILTYPKSCHSQQLVEKHGGVDVLVNNAGMGARGGPKDGDPDDWLKVKSSPTHYLSLLLSLTLSVRYLP